MESFKHELFEDFLKLYSRSVHDGLSQRWRQIKPDIYANHFHDCVGALLSRQATLTLELAQAPMLWNPHSAPLFLRSMIDVFLTLAWIIEDPEDRSEKFKLYGLGQEKLFLEHLEGSVREDPDSIDSSFTQEVIDESKDWLENQISSMLTEVNVGSWSGISARDMAKEIGRESIYKFAYLPFSGVVHSMWQHVGKYNVEPCQNPLHKNHLIPVLHELPICLDLMYTSAKYISITYEMIDDKMKIECEVDMPALVLLNHALFSEDDSSNTG